MKKNWIKGLDRIVFLLAIPLVIISGSLFVRNLAKSNEIPVYLTPHEKTVWIKNYSKFLEEMKKEFIINDEEIAHLCIFGDPSKNGIIASGRVELDKIMQNNPIAKQAIKRAISEGGDPSGTLTINHHCNLKLIPGKSKHYTFGILGGLALGSFFILGVMLLTRVVPKIYRWTKEGFICE